MKKIFKGMVTILITLMITGVVVAGDIYYVHSHNIIDKVKMQRRVDTWNDIFEEENRRSKASMQYARQDHRYYLVVDNYDEYGRITSSHMYDVEYFKELEENRRLN